jgi:hypothetical protein
VSVRTGVDDGHWRRLRHTTFEESGALQGGPRYPAPTQRAGAQANALDQFLGFTANMHRDLSLRAAKAGDPGEVPQQYHATAVQLMGQAAQRASILVSEALSSLSKEVAPSAAAEQLGTQRSSPKRPGTTWGVMRSSEAGRWQGSMGKATCS